MSSTNNATLMSTHNDDAQTCKPIAVLDFDYALNVPKNQQRPFYAIICKGFSGVTASSEFCAEMEAKYPDARIWAVPDWETFVKLWADDCRELHRHPSPSPSPSPSPAPGRAASAPAQLVPVRDLSGPFVIHSHTCTCQTQLTYLQAYSQKMGLENHGENVENVWRN
ncbi:hypothetical protein B0H12DRAFT_1230608 [Mycena haematopus]|nr:hypothetical protein B0H12DRAFT_1230608 [Mycena haematopus]